MASKKNGKEKPDNENAENQSGGTMLPDKQGEPVYDVADFVKNALKIFGTMPECVEAAFRCKGVKRCTKTEATEIVSKFINKEVK